jgi:hypothetical protein
MVQPTQLQKEKAVNGSCTHGDLENQGSLGQVFPGLPVDLLCKYILLTFSCFCCCVFCVCFFSFS